LVEGRGFRAPHADRKFEIYEINYNLLFGFCLQKIQNNKGKFI